MSMDYMSMVEKHGKEKIESLIEETIVAIRDFGVEDVGEFLDNLYLQVDSNYEENYVILSNAFHKFEDKDKQIEIKLCMANSKIGRPRSLYETTNSDDLRMLNEPKDVQIGLRRSIIRVPEDYDWVVMDIKGFECEVEDWELYCLVEIIMDDWFSTVGDRLGAKYLRAWGRISPIYNLVEKEMNVTVDDLVLKVYGILRQVFYEATVDQVKAESLIIAQKIMTLITGEILPADYSDLQNKLSKLGSTYEGDYDRLMMNGPPKDRELFYLVREAVNDWDPIGILFTIDEYDPEVGDIAYLLKTMPELTVDDLAEGIRAIFTKWFNLGIFEQPKESCIPTAQRIHSSIARRKA